tara:strand:+ start:1277 stop:1564 length:288 start_codon:yes stop_codon:yes gene_type:complete
MGSKQLRSVVPEYVKERLIRFKRQDDGTFKKITSMGTRNIRTNQVVSDELDELVSDESYKLTSGDDYDHEMNVQNHLGKNVAIRFKAISIEENRE